MTGRARTPRDAVDPVSAPPRARRAGPVVLVLPVVVLAIALGILAGCGSSSSGSSGSSGGPTGSGAATTGAGAGAATTGAGRSAIAPAVTIKNFSFGPSTVTVAVGTTVTWTNTDDAPHTVTARDASFSSPTLSKGKSFSFTFRKAGTYSYLCSIHQYMSGTVVVHG